MDENHVNLKSSTFLVGMPLAGIVRPKWPRLVTAAGRRASLTETFPGTSMPEIKDVFRQFFSYFDVYSVGIVYLDSDPSGPPRDLAKMKLTHRC